MPLWASLLAMAVLGERLDRRAPMALGVGHAAVLLALAGTTGPEGPSALGVALGPAARRGGDASSDPLRGFSGIRQSEEHLQNGGPGQRITASAGIKRQARPLSSGPKRYSQSLRFFSQAMEMLNPSRGAGPNMA